jgi:hypothetical protein
MHLPADAARATDFSGRIRPAVYAERLSARGLTVLRRPGGWRAQCPCHDDHEPSLFISEGRDQALLLHCHGCDAEFADLLAAVGVRTAETLPSSRYDRTESAEYLTTCSTDRDAVLRSIPRTARIGIDPVACRAALDEDHSELWGGDYTVKTPSRAGKVMRLVLEDLVELANERLRGGWRTTPIAYGGVMGAKRVGARPADVRRALRSLESQGAIERVGRLPMLGIEGAGAWTWRLVVQA